MTDILADKFRSSVSCSFWWLIDPFTDIVRLPSAVADGVSTLCLVWTASSVLPLVDRTEVLFWSLVSGIAMLCIWFSRWVYLKMTQYRCVVHVNIFKENESQLRRRSYYVTKNRRWVFLMRPNWAKNSYFIFGDWLYIIPKIFVDMAIRYPEINSQITNKKGRVYWNHDNFPIAFLVRKWKPGLTKLPIIPFHTFKKLLIILLHIFS